MKIALFFLVLLCGAYTQAQSQSFIGVDACSCGGCGGDKK